MKTTNKIQLFTDLHAWQEGHKLVLVIYKTTKTFPKEEMFGLTSQMRRCVVSITSNIAEGFSRGSYKEKSQFYSMAQGSLTELQNQLLISRDTSYLSQQDFDGIWNQTIIVHKITNGLIKKSKSFIHSS
jgi:four helix bundle protein